jgi:ion channel
MNPAEPHTGMAAALALAMLSLTTAIHYEALELISRAAHGRGTSRRGIVGLLTALVGVHLTEVALYAIAYAAGAHVFSLGSLSGSSGKSWIDFFYFAAETYSTLGYGDLVPIGSLRLVASVEALNGLLLVAWSGAFLYGVLEDARRHRSRPWH